MKLILDFSSYYLGLPIVHSELSGVVICFNLDPLIFLLLFPCWVLFFLYLFIYLFVCLEMLKVDPKFFGKAGEEPSSLCHKGTTWFSSVGNQRRWLNNFINPTKITCTPFMNHVPSLWKVSRLSDFWLSWTKNVKPPDLVIDGASRTDLKYSCSCYSFH